MNDILVFDTNIFLLGTNINLNNAIIYTTPSIIEEIKVERYLEKNRNILNRIQVAQTNEKLIIKTPSSYFLEKVEKHSKFTGDARALSRADKDLIALTIELIETQNENVILYTNDYSMENVCFQMNIPFSPFKKEGIKRKIVWQRYCPFCKTIKETQQGQEYCEVCGEKLRRKPKKSKY